MLQARKRHSTNIGALKTKITIFATTLNTCPNYNLDNLEGYLLADPFERNNFAFTTKITFVLFPKVSNKNKCFYPLQMKLIVICSMIGL